jgi:hypothetical protein
VTRDAGRVAVFVTASLEPFLQFFLVLALQSFRMIAA